MQLWMLMRPKSDVMQDGPGPCGCAHRMNCTSCLPTGRAGASRHERTNVCSLSHLWIPYVLYTHMCAWLANGRESDGPTWRLRVRCAVRQWRAGVVGGGGAVLSPRPAMSVSGVSERRHFENSDGTGGSDVDDGHQQVLSHVLTDARVT